MTQKITFFHSPDADDAFMFYGMVSGNVTVPGYEFAHDLKDIESLNQMAKKGLLDSTAVSVHAYAYLSDQYSILRYGASMGEKEYGPKVVVKPGITWGDIKRVAVPGELTSALLSFKLYLAESGMKIETPLMDFDRIQEAVIDGTIEAGLIIHEGQITHERAGLVEILDLGKWWWKKHQLPLPLGVNVIKKSLSADAQKACAKALKESIEYSLAHREDALQYALSYGRGLSHEDADTFVGMYVNERTRDLGAEGMKSIELFLKEGFEQKLIPRLIVPEFIG